MTALTLPTKHRSLWHFVPGLALTAALTGAALWAGSFPAIAGAGFSALRLPPDVRPDCRRRRERYFD